ncbi:MAG: cell envelope integrity protein TolA, partial [Vibrionaceae bacterium]
KEVTRDSHDAGAQEQSNTRVPSVVISALRQEEPRAIENRPAINQPIKLTEHKLRAIEEEMAETIEFFQSLANRPPQQEAESKAASEDNAASGDAIKNAKTQSDRAADHKAASQETAQQDETQAEEGSNGAFFFGGAKAMPTRRVKDDAEVEKYKHDYEQWAADEAEKAEQLRRQKRRAAQDVDPLHYLKLDYAAAKPDADPIDLSGIEDALNDYILAMMTEDPDTPEGRTEIAAKFLDLEYAITKERFHKDNPANTFLSDAADLYTMRMFDTDPHVRQGFAYYQQRVREAAKQGLGYYDTGLDEFYGRKMSPYYDDPENGRFYRTSSLIAKTLAAV